jgi:hypothetical protein
MTPVNLLTDSVESLWYFTYGIIAGWGVTFTVFVVAIVVLIVRSIRQSQRISRLEERLIHAERDYNLSLSKWQK